MSTFRDYRKESRSIWGTTLTEDEEITIQQIQTGAFLRIADAMELMAKNHAQLIEERDMYKRWHAESRKREEKLQRQVNAYKGIVKRKKQTK